MGLECEDPYFRAAQEALNSAMPWIGTYIAAASAVCALAMVADAINGFRRKKYWLPCKYFTLNAFSITLLAVAMKLPVDLTSLALNSIDIFAKMSSLLLMSTAVNHFMISLGAMENTEIVLNMAAIGILVITIAGNVCIHLVQMYEFENEYEPVSLALQVAPAVSMLLFLGILCCMSLMVPGAKRYIGLKYNEMHKSVSNRQVGSGRFSSGELENLVKAYWVMAETSSPQFVLARSAISSASGLLCLLTALVLAIILYAHLTYYTESEFTRRLEILTSSTDYEWSVALILCIQLIGVAMGTIAPMLRWFTASRFKIAEMERKSFRDELKVQNYWTWRLVQWREISLTNLQVQNRVCKKLLRVALRFVLSFCIGVQILFVSAAKLALFLSAKFVSAVFLGFGMNKRPVSVGAHVGFNQYVILLEGEPQLPSKILKNICNEADKLIKVGQEKQPNNLIQLLQNSSNFNGVGRFDSSQVPRLHSQEPPNCWSMPVVTLAAISVALAHEKAHMLLVRYREGLSIVKLIEETLDRTGELESIINAAHVIWDEVDLYKKWNDIDLKSTRERGATQKETLQNLSKIAEKNVRDHMAQTRDILMQNPLHWPPKVIAANSMYRITQTLLLGMGDGEDQDDGENQDDNELFESISIIISDILAACLTNLVQVITLKCHRNDIREREESVRRAAILLGESKEILEILQPRKLPSLDVEKAAKIDEWRASVPQDHIV